MSESLSPVLCVFGTASDVGKSWITTGLCRAFRQDGVDVAPYKAQNMSNNAGVTLDGLEMGRAQVVQAMACGLQPHVDMNPLLLKPNTETGAQVVLMGKVVGDMEARAYFSGGIEQRRGVVLAALDRLRARHELVIAEGAGSCAEVNLRDRDLVNMPVAHHANAPVLLVADIHKGGVFAQLVGTLEVMSPTDRARVKGFLVNRFRGDPSLFEDGVAWLQQRTGLPILGVVPWTRDIVIEEEDGLGQRPLDPPSPQSQGFHAAVLRLPHIANHTDLDALERHGVQVHLLSRPRDFSPYDVVILPGSKNTRGDLDFLRGWDFSGARNVLGLCGGYQMLGRAVHDPHGIEGHPGSSEGLGLLPVETTLAPTKTTRQSSGSLNGLPVRGYEIHVGETTVEGAPLLQLDTGPEGCRHSRATGTYLHGLFDEPGVVEALLGPMKSDHVWPALESHGAWRERNFDALADHLRAHVDLARIRSLLPDL